MKESDAVAGRISVFGRQGSAGSPSLSKAMTVSRRAFAHRERTQKPGVAERRLKGSIDSSVRASLRDAHAFPTIIPWLKPTATITQSLRDFPKSEIRPPARQSVKNLVPREGVGDSPC